MMIPRLMTDSLLAAAKEYPVVTLTGPRQAGKTTLVRAVFPEHRYCNLEHPELRRLASEYPKQFFHLHKEPLISGRTVITTRSIWFLRVRATVRFTTETIQPNRLP